MNDFLQRLITGIFFIVAIIGSIAWNHYSFTAMFSLITVLGLLEFYSLLNTENIYPQKILGAVSGGAIFLINAGVNYGYFGREYLFLSFLFFFIFFGVELFRKKSNPFTNIAFTFFSIIYIAIPLSLLINITSISVGEEQHIVYRPWILIAYFLLVWASDSGAYVSGRLFGRHKLFPRISPNKTWEGSIGGAFFVLGFGYLIYWLIPTLGLSPVLTFVDWIIMGAIIVVMGTFGDLIESLLKRSIYIKDSGSILPGHGGILDRFDSVFMSAPFVFVYLELFA